MIFGDAVAEVPWEEGAHILNECTYLYATDVREVEELTLSVKIVEAKAQMPTSEEDATGPLAWLKLGGSPIEQDETCRVFQLLFNRNDMISYTVMNESYGKYPEPPEMFTGKLFRTFSHSHLLEFTERTTYANSGHPGVLMHFEIACLNHVIDVICTAPPKISVGNWKASLNAIN